METNEQSSPLKHPHLKPLPPKRCPACSSVFYQDNKCDDCGYEKKEAPVLQAFGEGSIYDLRGDYWEFKPWYYRYLPMEDADYEKEYQENLLRRLKHVLTCNVGLSSQALELESYELIRELVLKGYPKERLFMFLNPFDERFADFLTRSPEKKKRDWSGKFMGRIQANHLLRYAIYSATFFLISWLFLLIVELGK